MMSGSTNNNNNASTSAYIIESQSVWHERLGHVNYDTMRKLINMDIIPKFTIDNQHKCEACVEAKLSRTSFHSIGRSSEPLELVHTDVCGMNIVQSEAVKNILSLLSMIAQDSVMCIC